MITVHIFIIYKKV